MPHPHGAGDGEGSGRRGRSHEPGDFARADLLTRRERLLALNAEIRACRRCHAAGYLNEHESLPLARDPRPADLPSILLVGQAPSRNEHESFAPPDDTLPPILLVGQAPGLRATIEGVPFAGISGAKLRQWFALAGFSEADFWRLIYFSAVTKCYPGRLPGAKGDRVPTPAEQALCRPWMDAQLAVLDPPIVVLVGQLAISTFLGKGPLHQFVGEGFEQAGRRWLPLPHPSGVSTWLNDRDNQARVARAMTILGGWLAELGIPVSGTPTPAPG